MVNENANANLIKKLEKQGEKQKKTILLLETILEKRDKKIKKLELDKQIFFSIEQNRELYANYKQFDALVFQRDQYKDLYEKAKNKVHRKHNERKAGRKPRIYEYLDTVKKLISNNEKISTREIAEKTGISHSSVATLIKIIENGDYK
jgi:hypothetical protein